MTWSIALLLDRLGQVVQAAQGFDRADIAFALDRVIVQEADDAVAQVRLGDQVAHDGAAHLTRADDQHAIDPLAGLAQAGEDEPADDAGQAQQQEDEQPGVDKDDA